MSQERQTGQTVQGTGVVAGLAYGVAHWVAAAEEFGAPGDGGPVAGSPPDPDQLERARERFTAAATTVADRLDQRAALAEGVSSEVLAANAVLARDRGWAKAVVKELKKGLGVEAATMAATETFVAMFAKIGGRQSERITDLRDICARVVAELRGLPEPGVPEFDEPGVLLADDLAPADTAGLDPAMILGIVCEHGGPTSHTAIIARQLGIPCVVAAAGLAAVADGARVLVDGGAGGRRRHAPTVARGAGGRLARALRGPPHGPPGGPAAGPGAARPF